MPKKACSVTKKWKCLWCSGTGWDSPPRENRQLCRKCGGEGELPEDHQWAGYCASYDYTKGGRA
jgi:DnaJ-class molecular chaperone